MKTIHIENSQKPIKAKPLFYSICFADLQRIARKMGYNLLIHGSLNRDMDLVCVPWIDKPKTHLQVLLAFSKYLGCPMLTNTEGKYDFMFRTLPGGRSSYVINLNRGGKWNAYYDEQYYLDISFTPLIKSNKQ